MSASFKLTGVFVLALIDVIGTIAILQRANQEPSGGAARGANAVASEYLVRNDSHRLGTSENDQVTIVEFLDFECEACLAMFPTMERLRADYAGEITFVVRYFPLPGHPNSMTAALAVEAAAQQGAFEPMYRKMYETQEQWGHTQASRRSTFVEYARELGLNIDQFEKTMDDPATKARVQRDIDDGTALGVSGTPTIYINGVETASMPSYESMAATIDAVLDEQATHRPNGRAYRVAGFGARAQE